VPGNWVRRAGVLNILRIKKYCRGLARPRLWRGANKSKQAHASPIYYLSHLPDAHYPVGPYSSCPRPVSRSCNSSMISTGPHPGSTICSATYFMGRSIMDVCQTSNPMIRHGLLNIWTRYTSVLHSLAPRLNQYHRSSTILTLPVPFSGSAYENSGVFVASGGYYQCHTRSHLSF